MKNDFWYFQNIAVIAENLHLFLIKDYFDVYHIKFRLNIWWAIYQTYHIPDESSHPIEEWPHTADHLQSLLLIGPLIDKVDGVPSWYKTECTQDCEGDACVCNALDTETKNPRGLLLLVYLYFSWHGWFLTIRVNIMGVLSALLLLGI